MIKNTYKHTYIHAYVLTYVHTYTHAYVQTFIHTNICAHEHTYYIRTYIHTHTYIYRVSQEECARFRESVSYVKLYRYNPKHLYLKLNGYGDNGQRILKL